MASITKDVRRHATLAETLAMKLQENEESIIVPCGGIAQSDCNSHFHTERVIELLERILEESA